MKQERFLPDRDLIVALTADEEIIPSRYNGLEYLLRTHRDLIDAEMALNEGGAGLINKEGRYLYLSFQAGEKVFQTYQLEVRSPGGHSSLPSKDNAIYHLAGGLSRLAKFDFPLRLSGPVRIYFERVSKFESGQVADDMGAILREPPDPAAVARLSDIPRYNAQLRTTCVATMLEAGHAMNALPQRARAIVNCRLLPGDSVEEVRRTLVRVLADERIEITPLGEAVISPPAPLTPQLLEPVERVSAQMWPGVPVIPTLAAAATDGRFLNNAGIPTYGISGLFRDIEGDGVHGLDERVRVKSLYESLEFLYRLIKALSS
jgi:acetylornithine deacetylase/succinyl-diaminopimelate desuccinylase-like protein